jgi:tetratricopeptide (TPR) repeat protein
LNYSCARDIAQAGSGCFSPGDRTIARVVFSVFAFCCLVFTAPATAGDGKDCVQTADLDLAIKGCTAIITRENETRGNRARAYNDRGEAYRFKGEHDRAIADYGRALELDPNCTEAYNNRGLAYWYEGEHDRAIADLGRAIADYGRAYELNPTHPDYWAYCGKGKHERAIADYFHHVLAPYLKLADAYYNRGNAYLDEGEYGRAIADYSRALELHPKFYYAYNKRGHAHFDTGDFAKASADFLHVIDGVGNSAYEMLLRYLARARLASNAASELEANASQLWSTEWPYAVIELYLGKRQPEATLAAASTPGEQCHADFYIGEWHILQNRPADAEPFLRKAVETCPKTFAVYTAAQAELKRLKP